MRGLLLGDDVNVAEWAFRTYHFHPSKFDLAIGIAEQNRLVGAALFQGYNGTDVQLSYYGKRTLSLGIVRSLAKIVTSLPATRLTIVTSKKNKKFIRAAEKIGFIREGQQRRYYGAQDTDRNVGVRLVMFKEQLDRFFMPR